jgi:hypothetical protein
MGVMFKTEDEPAPSRLDFLRSLSGRMVVP